MPIPSVRIIVSCFPLAMTLVCNAGPSRVPLTGGHLITKPAGVSPKNSGSFASWTLARAKCSSLTGNTACGSNWGWGGSLRAGDASPSRNDDGKVPALAGSGARRPSHDTTGPYSTVSPLQKVGNVARKYCVRFWKSLATSGADTVSTPRPSTRYRTLTAFEGLEGRTPTVTETPWRCSVVPSGAGASGVPYHSSSPSYASCTMSAILVRSWERKLRPLWLLWLLEPQGHNSPGVLYSEGKALEDGKHIAAFHVHLPELRCRFGGKCEIDRLARHREEHTPAPPLLLI